MLLNLRMNNWTVTAALLVVLSGTMACRGALEATPSEPAPAPQQTSSVDPNLPRPSSIESPGAEEQPASVGRIATPAWIPCGASDVNGYIGRVVRYEPRQGQLEIEIHTDWDTTEVVTVRHEPGRAFEHFRLDGEPFTESDWSKIEQRTGELVPNTRVRAWVCQTAGNPTVLDWRPGEITPPNPY